LAKKRSEKEERIRGVHGGKAKEMGVRVKGGREGRGGRKEEE